MNAKKTTIKDIAIAAGVSIATVSMILNNKDKNISQPTKEKVLSIAGELNYIPNQIARGLVTKKTRTLGLIIPDIANPFFPEIARGAEDKAREEGYSIIYCNTDDKLENEDRAIEVLTKKMVDGIILAHSAERKNKIGNSSIPIVLLDRENDISNAVGKVLVDNKKASYEGVSYLIKNGYKKIIYIAGPMHTQTALDRKEGYIEALTENGIPIDEKNIKIGEYKIQWGYEATKEFLNEKNKFDAVFCGNDLIAIGAIKAFAENKIKVPDDIGILGFDDIYIAALVQPPLTTIKQPNYEMGYKGAELLINALESKENLKNVNKKIILETKLIVRNSTK